MVLKKIIFGLLILIPFGSCVNIFVHPSSNLWFYAYSSGDMPTSFALTPSSFLYLNTDNTYTLDFGSFDYGKWVKRRDTLVLHSVGGKMSSYLINYESSKDLKLTVMPDVVSDFSAAPSKFTSPVANPFSLGNNKWRISANHKESRQEIRQRLINHCEFWKAYFSWALDNNIQSVDVRSTPTAIKIYGNGFALKKFDDLPAAWRRYFYDSADCRLANSMIENIFKKETIAWATTDNKYKMFLGAFEQLENFLLKDNADE